jgi:radical SAM protein with 4Fe4S-binding SPASM domain
MSKETFGLRHPFGAAHGRAGSPQLIGMRITDMCNLRCHSCGQWGDNGYLHGVSLKELKAREVPVETYIKMVDEVADAGWSPIWYIWGGEPMMYPGLSDLLYHIKKRGMAISVVTNGTKVAENAEMLLDTCDILHISLDGPNAEIHNKQRPGIAKNHDNFKNVKAALEAISEGKKERGQVFPFLAPISCITSYNIDYVIDLYNFAAQYADLHILYLTWWIDAMSAIQHTADFERRFGYKPKTHLGWVGDWKEFDHSLILERYDEMVEISKKTGKCPPIMMPKLNEVEDVKEYYSNHKATFGYDQCVSIHMTMELDSDGSVSPCRDYHDYVIGNIREESIVDLWNNEKAIKFRQSLTKDGLMPACRRCCGLMGF